MLATTYARSRWSHRCSHEGKRPCRLVQAFLSLTYPAASWPAPSAGNDIPTRAREREREQESRHTHTCIHRRTNPRRGRALCQSCRIVRERAPWRSRFQSDGRFENATGHAECTHPSCVSRCGVWVGVWKTGRGRQNASSSMRKPKKDRAHGYKGPKRASRNIFLPPCCTSLDTTPGPHRNPSTSFTIKPIANRESEMEN
jgi:hypothetical protein